MPTLPSRAVPLDDVAPSSCRSGSPLRRVTPFTYRVAMARVTSVHKLSDFPTMGAVCSVMCMRGVQVVSSGIIRMPKMRSSLAPQFPRH